VRTRIVAWVNLDSQVLFAVPSSNGLFTELGNESLHDVARAGGFLRHEAFDWAAGDAGAKCVLLEWRGLPESPDAAQAPLDAATVLPDVLLFGSTQWQGVRWLAFPLAARALVDGSDRRFLQLAVQYVSSGGVVEDNVVAADADAGFLGQLGKALEDKK
jgi:hypothetical protein